MELTGGHVTAAWVRPSYIHHCANLVTNLILCISLALNIFVLNQVEKPIYWINEFFLTSFQVILDTYRGSIEGFCKNETFFCLATADLHGAVMDVGSSANQVSHATFFENYNLIFNHTEALQYLYILFGGILVFFKAIYSLHREQWQAQGLPAYCAKID